MKSIDTEGGAVYTIDFDPTNKTIFAGIGDGSFRAFNIETGASTNIEVAIGWGQHVWDVSRDGRFLAGPGKGGIVIWDQKTYREVRTIPGNAGGTFFVAFSPDGRTLASTGRDGVLRLWDVRTGKAISAPGSGWNRVRFSLDGRSLATFGQDQKIHIFGPAPAGKPVPAPQPPPVIDDPELQFDDGSDD